MGVKTNKNGKHSLEIPETDCPVRCDDVCTKWKRSVLCSQLVCVCKEFVRPMCSVCWMEWKWFRPFQLGLGNGSLFGEVRSVG